MQFSNQALIDVKYNNIDATLEGSWRSNSIRFLNFLTPNFIPEENEREMQLHPRRKWTWNVHARHKCVVQDVKCTNFVHDFSVWSLRVYWPNYILLPEAVFRWACFLVSSSNVLRAPFLEHLCAMASLSSNEKYFIVATRGSFKGNQNFHGIFQGKTCVVQDAKCTNFVRDFSVWSLRVYWPN